MNKLLLDAIEENKVLFGALEIIERDADDSKDTEIAMEVVRGLILGNAEYIAKNFKEE